MAALEAAFGCQVLYSRPRASRGGSANRRFVAKTADRAERARFSREGAPPRVPGCRAGQAFWRGFWRPRPGRPRLAGRRGGRGIFRRDRCFPRKARNKPRATGIALQEQKCGEKRGRSVRATAGRQKRFIHVPASKTPVTCLINLDLNGVCSLKRFPDLRLRRHPCPIWPLATSALSARFEPYTHNIT